MSIDKALLAKAWHQYWTGKTPLPLGETPAYPLARTVAMPEGHPYESGALGFRMTDLTLAGVENLDPNSSGPTAAGGFKLSLEHLRLTGQYTLEVKPDPISKLDTGGDLMELPDHVTRPDSGGADQDGPNPDPQTEEWLDQARTERTKLASTPNGQQLLLLYSQHNETYQDVFQNNAALQTNWKAEGATQQMAGDTHAALQTDDVVNKSDKAYAGGVTYNLNAFRQALNVATACIYQDPDFDPYSPDLPADSKYVEAARAALSFNKGVTQNTGNTKDTTQEMKSTQIYGTVEAQKQGLPEVSQEELQNLAAQGGGLGGSNIIPAPDWVKVDEDDRQRMRTLFESTMRQRAENATVKGQPFYTGTLAAEIDRLEAVVSLDPQGVPVAVHVELPAFDLQIDDSQWEGAVGAVARQRLESMVFVRSLLHDAVVDKLGRALQDAVTATYREA